MEALTAVRNNNENLPGAILIKMVPQPPPKRTYAVLGAGIGVVVGLIIGLIIDKIGGSVFFCALIGALIGSFKAR